MIWDDCKAAGFMVSSHAVIGIKLFRIYIFYKVWIRLVFRIYLFSKVWIRWGVKKLHLPYNSGLERSMVNDGDQAMVAIWNAIVLDYNTNSNNRCKVEY